MGITEIFGTNVFSENIMRERLPAEVFAEVKKAMDEGGRISMKTADVVCNSECICTG